MTNVNIFTVWAKCALFIALFTTISINLSAIPCGNFRTQTQGGWGSNVCGNNPGTYLHSRFYAAFPNGLTIGCTNKLVLTSPRAVTDFLPSGGNASLLPRGIKTNPGSCYRNVLAGQIVALKLSVTFDKTDAQFSGSNVLLENLVIKTGKFAGKTVGFVLAEAEKAIGGCSNTTTSNKCGGSSSGNGSQYSLSDFNAVLTSINENFVDGKTDKGFLACPPDPCATDAIAPVITGAPTASLTATATGTCANVTWTAPTATDNCTLASLTSNYAPNTCFPVGTTTVTYTAKDAAGNTSTVSFDVVVKAQEVNSCLNDVTAPTFANCPKSYTVYTTELCAAGGWKEPTATDNCSAVTMTNNYSPTECLSWNTYKVVYTATDASGNVGTCTFNLTIFADQALKTNTTNSMAQVAKSTNTATETATTQNNNSNLSVDPMTNSGVQTNNLAKTPVFPNPASDYVHMDLSKYDGKTVTVSLANMMGQVMKSATTEAMAGGNYSIDLSDVQNGAYILTIMDEKGKKESSLVRVSKN